MVEVVTLRNEATQLMVKESKDKTFYWQSIAQRIASTRRCVQSTSHHLGTVLCLAEQKFFDIVVRHPMQ